MNRLSYIAFASIWGLASGLCFAGASPWEEVDSVIRGAMGRGVFSRGVLFEVYDSRHRLLHCFEAGGLKREEALPVLSSSKWIAAATILSLVDRGVLELDSPMALFVRDRKGAPLSEPFGRITLRQLLSFTSGLPAEHPCFKDVRITMAECALQLIEDPRPKAAPGAEFRYSDNHLAVAGAMAESAAKKPWREIFEENIAKPLGFRSRVEWYARPREKKGEGNPRPAAGLRISFDDYLRFLRMIYNRGLNDEGKRVLSEKAIREMEADQLGSGTRLGPSLATELGMPSRYGLGQWVEYRNADFSGSTTVSSVGHDGWLPWIDRGNGYYAVIGAYEGRSVARESRLLANQLMVLIERYVRGEPSGPPALRGFISPRSN